VEIISAFEGQMLSPYNQQNCTHPDFADNSNIATNDENDSPRF